MIFTYVDCDKLLGVLGQEEFDKLFLNKEWIRKNSKNFRSNRMPTIKKYRIAASFYRGTTDDGNGNFKGSMYFYETEQLEDMTKDFPEEVKTLDGNFMLKHCEKLKTLKGCPAKVTGDFDIVDCGLETLGVEDLEVGGWSFCLRGNNLRSIEGLNLKASNDISFDISGNVLTSLKGSPKTVGAFNCSSNLLKSFKFGPKLCKLNYNANYNDKNLEERDVEKFTVVQGRINI